MILFHKKKHQGSSTLETGLIWGLIITLFLLLVGWVYSLYDWIEQKFSDFSGFNLVIFNFFT